MKILEKTVKTTKNLLRYDLHRQPGVPEWELIPKAEWNEYQRRAAETNGWDTPGNRITTKGMAKGMAGLGLLSSGNIALQCLGLGLLGSARVDDVRDGIWAKRTGTRSPKGEVLDVVVDKLVLAGTIAVAALKNVIKSSELMAMGVQQSANIALTGVAKLRHRPIHTGRPGKFGMLGLGIGTGSHFLGRIFRGVGMNNAGDAIDMVGTGFTYAGIALSSFSTVTEYMPAAFGRSAPSLEQQETLLPTQIIEIQQPPEQPSI